MSFAVGSLVRARGREWVVLPESEEDLLSCVPWVEQRTRSQASIFPSRPSRPLDSTCPIPPTWGIIARAVSSGMRCVSALAGVQALSVPSHVLRSSRAPTNSCPC
jgi:hypothetical protein